MRTRMAVWLMALAVATPVVARDDDTLQEKVRAARDDPKKAGELLGDAAALAHRTKDLVAEWKACQVFQSVDSRRSSEAIDPLILALRGKLDASRRGAFFSAPSLSGDLLLTAVATGDSSALAVIAADLKPHAGGKSGKALALLASFAAAVIDARGETPENGVARLEDTLKEATEEGWVDVAMAAGVELASLHVKAGNDTKAIAAVEAVGGLLSARKDNRFSNYAMRAVEKRLADAPESVRASWDSAMKAFMESRIVSGGAGGAGGAGGDGKDADSGGLAPLGEALKHGRAGRLATVQRTETGFDFRVSWDPKFRGTHARTEGTRYLANGGLTVGFVDWAVAVAMVDPYDKDGQPGETPTVQSGLAWYRLARGETWSISKDGVVSIAPGR